MNNIHEQFRAEIRAAGLEPPEIVEADGKKHRFATNGEHSDDAGEYRLYPDSIPAGYFKDYRSGLYKEWQADIGRKPSPAEESAHQARIEIMRKDREAESAREGAEAAAKSMALWKAATEVRPDHPYLTRKGVQAVATLREISAEQAAEILGYRPKAKGNLLVGRLLVAPVKIGDEVSTAELIDEVGRKSAIAGGKKRGGYWAAQQLPDGDGVGLTILIGEGVATTLSSNAASEYPSIAALSAGNLHPVAIAMRERYPDAELVLLADMVKETGKPDPHAVEAARAIGGKLATPDFGDNRQEGEKDFNDLHKSQGLEAVRHCIEIVRTPEGIALTEDSETSGDDANQRKPNQASALVAFVETHAELFHDQNKDVYAQDRTTRETRRIDGRQFHDWLLSSFYQATGKSARDQSVREALGTLAGLGRFRGECIDVHLRVAAHGDAYYLDLAEPGKNRAVRIKAGRWEVVCDPPVRFIRPESMRPLPTPEPGGDIAGLWRIANIPEESRLLVLAWLADSLRPDTPFPVLELIGEQGSAKSTTQTALRRLIDPNACDLRAAPKAPEDIFVSAGASWLVSYENISHLSAPMQDALCVLATGGGFATRKLYTNAEEAIITVKRPVVLNGISAAVTAQDLVDRCLSIETPTITHRCEVNDLWGQFEATHGRLLGALLDLMTAALERLSDTHLPPEDRPRLAEFARLGMAMAEATGETGAAFMVQFYAHRQESIARTIDASPVATAVIEWIDKHPSGRSDTAKALMTEMGASRPPHGEAWPRTPKGFADALRRAAPALRQIGIECRCLPKTGGVIRWEIRPRGNLPNTCPESPACPAVENGEQDIRTCRTSSPVFSPGRRNGTYGGYEGEL